MPDDKSKPSGQARNRININEDYEGCDGSEEFGITPEELKADVKAVGSNAENVEAHQEARLRRQ
jgi:hypothetical protein